MSAPQSNVLHSKTTQDTFMADKQTNTSKHVNPWYKEPWAWLVAAPLLLVFVACAITVTIAFRMADDRVSDNYYKEGRMLSQEFTSDEYAKMIGVKAALDFNLSKRVVIARLDLEQVDKLRDLSVLKLLVSHPAEQSKDVKLTMLPVTKNVFRAVYEPDLQGRWYLRLQGLAANESELWRLHGEIDFNEQHAVRM